MQCKFPQIMGKGFEAELDFRSGQTSQTQSSELAAFLDLAEHGLGFNRTVAPVFQPLFACEQFPGSCLVTVKCMVHLYLPVPS